MDAAMCEMRRRSLSAKRQRSLWDCAVSGGNPRSTARPQLREIEGQLPMVPDGQQIHGAGGFRNCVEDQVVPVQVLAKCSRSAGRQGCELCQGLGGLRWCRQIGATDAWEMPQIWNDGCAQLVKQRVIGKCCIGFGKECLDGFQAFDEAGRQLDAANFFQPRFLAGRERTEFLAVAARRSCSKPIAASASKVRLAAISARPRFASSISSR